MAPYPLEQVETDADGRAQLEAALPLTPYSHWLTSVVTALQALLFFVRFENMPRYLAEAVALAEQVALPCPSSPIFSLYILAQIFSLYILAPSSLYTSWPHLLFIRLGPILSVSSSSFSFLMMIIMTRHIIASSYDEDRHLYAPARGDGHRADRAHAHTDASVPWSDVTMDWSACHASHASWA